MKQQDFSLAEIIDDIIEQYEIENVDEIRQLIERSFYERMFERLQMLLSKEEKQAFLEGVDRCKTDEELAAFFETLMKKHPKYQQEIQQELQTVYEEYLVETLDDMIAVVMHRHQLQNAPDNMRQEFLERIERLFDDAIMAGVLEALDEKERKRFLKKIEQDEEHALVLIEEAIEKYDLHDVVEQEIITVYFHLIHIPKGMLEAMWKDEKK